MSDFPFEIVKKEKKLSRIFFTTKTLSGRNNLKNPSREIMPSLILFISG